MGIEIRELIAQQFARTDPLVLAGSRELHRIVEWVHSSEIYEISPLLSGGELLLTTGLGLAGVDAGTRRHYIREISGRGVAGLAIELGRTFTEIPADMVDEAVSARFPLIALRRVVPFIDLCRDANTDIVSREIGGLRTRTALAHALDAELVAGNGVAGVLARTADVIGAPVLVTSLGGALVAAHGVDDDHSAWAAITSESAAATILARRSTWGTLHAGPGSPLTATELSALLELAAQPLSLALTYTGYLGGLPHRVGTALLTELLDGRSIRTADLVMRCATAGFHPPRGSRVVAAAIDTTDVRIASMMLETVSRALGTTSMLAVVHATAFALIAITDTDPVGVVASAFRSISPRDTVDGTTVVVGDASELDSAALSRSLTTVLATLRIAVDGRRTRHVADAVTTSRELIPDLILDGLPTDRALALIGSIEPVVTWDRDHSGNLCHTLEVHLRHGGSATRSAAALHLGRQSLYQRLDRIRTLLGFDVADPALHTTLLLALAAHRRSN